MSKQTGYGFILVSTSQLVAMMGQGHNVDIATTTTRPLFSWGYKLACMWPTKD